MGTRRARRADEPDCLRPAGRKRSGSRATAAHRRRACSRSNRRRATPTRRSRSTSTTASADPEQAGAHSVSHIVVSRPDGNDMLTGSKLSLPAGAAGSLSAVPKCPLGQAQAGDCPESTLVGNIKTTLGSGISLFTVPGKLYLAEPARARRRRLDRGHRAGQGRRARRADGQVPDRPRARRGDRQPPAAARGGHRRRRDDGGRLPRRRSRSATASRRCSRACRCRSARSRSPSTARASS